MSGYRRAVVALHDVCEHDRNWILALLPAAERAKLECYLDELKSLGFAAGTAFSQPESAPNRAPSNSPMQAASGDDARSVAAHLRTVSAHRIAAVLRTEPPALVAQFLAIEAWPWSEAVLQHFEPGFRQRVNHARSGRATMAPSRRRFLTQAVASRLRTMDADSLISRRPIARAARRVAHGLWATINRLSVPWRR
jgi:hypothetical protein